MAESRRRPNRFARRLFAGLPRRYDLLAGVLSLGQDARWRRALVAPVAASGARSVLDVATGTGSVALELCRRSPAEVTGLDLTPEMLAAGATRIGASREADRIRLVAGRAEQLPFPDATFDALTVTYLFRYVAEPAAVLRELVRVVKPGGVVASMEFGVPAGPLWHPMWLAYTRAILPVAGALAGGRAWWVVGRFLGPSISAHYRRFPLAWQVEAWETAGIRQLQVRHMSVGGGVVMWGRVAARG